MSNADSVRNLPGCLGYSIVYIYKWTNHHSHTSQYHLLMTAFMYQWGIMLLLNKDYAHTSSSEPTKNKPIAMSQPSILYQYATYPDWSIQTVISITNLLPRSSVWRQVSPWQWWWATFLYPSWLSGVQLLWAGPQIPQQSFWADHWIPFCLLPVNTIVQIMPLKVNLRQGAERTHMMFFYSAIDSNFHTSPEQRA